MNIRDPLSEWSEPEAVASWREKISSSSDVTWLDYINYYVHPDTVAVVARLLFPAFVEHEGGVFFQERFTLSGFSTWKAQLGEITAVEKIINHLHIYDIFALVDEIPESSFKGVANLMAQTVRLALRASFPDRQFYVYVSDSDQDYGPVLGFYSVECAR